MKVILSFHDENAHFLLIMVVLMVKVGQFLLSGGSHYIRSVNIKRKWGVSWRYLTHISFKSHCKVNISLCWFSVMQSMINFTFIYKL